MRTLAELCRRLLDAGVRTPWIRGRVHKISIVAGGEVSVVIRFGMDEPQARQLVQGALVEVSEVKPKPAPTLACPLGATTHNEQMKNHGFCPGCLHGEVQQQGKGGSGPA